MTKQLHKLAFFALVLWSVNASAQFNLSDVKYWIGSGTDSSMLVVDFHDGTTDTSYAWGYLYSGSATGEDMLNDVAAADVNLSVAIASGFLNDITYGSHSGIGGTGGFYWSTWDGPSIAGLNMNAGISAALSNGSVFGCSFTDFAPAIPTGEPIPAFDPFYFTAQDVNFWVGTGSDTTLFVIDFLDGSGASSLAWGYLHNSGETGEDMLNAISAADPNLTVATAGGFLNDITYNSFSGLGGNPNYWGTWSATNLGDWQMNAGLSTALGNGDLFGCSYTDFTPAIRPGYPAAAPNTIGVAELSEEVKISIYPNPAANFINVDLSSSTGNYTSIAIVDAMGKSVYSESLVSRVAQIPIHQLPTGVYTLVVSEEGNYLSQHFVKR